MNEWESVFDGVVYNDPRDELRARAAKAAPHQDTHIAVSVELIKACLAVKECEARTVVNGGAQRGTLIEIKCQRLVSPIDGKHMGMHVHGRINWSGSTSIEDPPSDPLLEELISEKQFADRVMEELRKHGLLTTAENELILEYETRRANETNTQGSQRGT